MTFSCEVGEYAPEFYAETVHTRRRGSAHCPLCAGSIRPGERYRRCRGVWEGEWTTHVAHEDCHQLMSDAGLMLCGVEGYAFGDSLDDASAGLMALDVRGNLHGGELRDWLLRYESIWTRAEVAA